MPRTVITESDFLLLRAETDQAIAETRQSPPGEVGLPSIAGGSETGVETTAGDLLETTLGAIARATRKLRDSEMAIDLGSRPLEMSFSGSITRLSDGGKDIFINLEQ